MAWLSAYRADVHRYVEYSGKPALWEILIQQGLWALLGYRLANDIFHSSAPGGLRQFILLGFMIYQKWMEIVTGISLPYSAEIGPGLYIGHFGPVILNPGVRLGSRCNLSQGVTVGVSGRGAKRGVPEIGDRVYIGPNAVVAGKIKIGNDVLVGANSLVNQDVPDHCTVLGVPAVVINHKGSEGYI